MILGKVIKSNSHTDYVCQVYEAGEVAVPPARDDHSFGTFVRIGLDERRWLAGIVYDTLLFNPEFGRLGPRLSSATDLALFSPDYLNEKVTLAGIVAIGLIDNVSRISQGVPRLAANTDAFVEQMSDAEVAQFHQPNARFQLAYAPVLLALGSPLSLHLLRFVSEQLVELLPGQSKLLAIVRDNLIWRAQVGPFGSNGS